MRRESGSADWFLSRRRLECSAGLAGGGAGASHGVVASGPALVGAFECRRYSAR